MVHLHEARNGPVRLPIVYTNEPNGSLVVSSDGNSKINLHEATSKSLFHFSYNNSVTKTFLM